jgi:predicted ester cyclase
MSPAKSGSAKQVAATYFAAVAEQDIDAMMECWEQGKTGYIHGIAELTVPDGYYEYFGGMFRAMPDFRFEVLENVAYGGTAAVRWRARGTFNGSARFEGLDPTGASVDIQGCDVLTVSDGLIRELHAYTNATELARQLGAMPPAGSVAEKGMLAMVNARTSLIAAIRKRRG